MRAIAMEQTLLLLNNFITNTTTFLNVFADSCERKISTVSAKINEIEITMAVLEAKLNSIPGLEFTSADLPPAAAAVDMSPPAQPSSLPDFGEANAVPAAMPAVIETAASELEVVDSGMIAAKDHPEYARFFKLLKLGVPAPVVMAKLEAEGLDPTMVDTPDALVPKPESIEGLD